MNDIMLKKDHSIRSIRNNSIIASGPFWLMHYSVVGTPLVTIVSNLLTNLPYLDKELTKRFYLVAHTLIPSPLKSLDNRL